MRSEIEELFEGLHAHPEASGQERETEKILKDFIHTHTKMTLRDLPGGFSCLYHGYDPEKRIVIRADYDAVEVEEGVYRHLCGHDGHSSALCLLGLLLEERGSKDDVVLLFQSSEENGEGAKKCLEVLEGTDEIYGAHNLPGFPLGEVYTKKGTFACASAGLLIRIKGRSAHAAYPESGLSPERLLRKILKVMEKYDSLPKMATLIEVKAGEEAYGVMAHDCDIAYTLRSESEEGLEEMMKEVKDLIEREKGELTVSYEEKDRFPATVNHEECVRKVLERTGGHILTEPRRWSEDFGHYLKRQKGAYLGIGAGVDTPDLHTADYCYPKELIEKTAEVFYQIINEKNR